MDIIIENVGIYSEGFVFVFVVIMFALIIPLTLIMMIGDNK